MSYPFISFTISSCAQPPTVPYCSHFYAIVFNSSSFLNVQKYCRNHDIMTQFRQTKNMKYVENRCAHWERINPLRLMASLALLECKYPDSGLCAHEELHIVFLKDFTIFILWNCIIASWLLRKNFRTVGNDDDLKTAVTNWINTGFVMPYITWRM